MLCANFGRAGLYITFLLILLQCSFAQHFEEESGRSEAAVQTRIVGGTAASVGEFPFIAYFETRVSRSTVNVCGGALISASHLITAAHCCINPETGTDDDVAVRKGSVVQIGGYRLSSMRNGIDGESAGGERRVVAETHVPPSHRLGTNVDDICIAAQPVRIRMNFSPTVPALPGTATAIGWGTIANNNTQPDVLQKVSVPYVANRECDLMYGAGGKILPSMICAGDVLSGGKDTCQGDSGGPLFTGSVNNFMLMGLTSFGAGCGDPAYPGVYTRVSSFQEFICKVTESEPYDCPGGTDTGVGVMPSSADGSRGGCWVSFLLSFLSSWQLQI